MAVEGGLKCVKYLVFFFNFIFWLCGLALIVVGVLVQVSLHSTLSIKDPSASGAPILLIALGVIVFLVAFFGCCGAWKENYCMVTMFAILMSLVIIAEIGAAIAGYIYRNKVSVVVQDSLADMINNYNNSSDEFRATVDKLQHDLKCCGANSSSDWRSSTPEGNTVPDSCCINDTKNCGKGTMSDASKVYQKGCHDAVEAVLKANIQWVIVAALVIALFQILGVVFACLLMKGIRSGYEVM
ncbi:CD63 antigen [Eucyclogobius newberryi]|uniref:CD63 antigen n=1 Tax=Eucyclogobius newberryi TaxID=166745 RepID=UPI003B5B5CF0